MAISCVYFYFTLLPHVIALIIIIGWYEVFSYGYLMCVFLFYIIATCYSLNTHPRLV